MLNCTNVIAHDQAWMARASLLALPAPASAPLSLARRLVHCVRPPDLRLSCSPGVQSPQGGVAAKGGVGTAKVVGRSIMMRGRSCFPLDCLLSYRHHLGIGRFRGSTEMLVATTAMGPDVRQSASANELLDSWPRDATSPASPRQMTWAIRC